MCLTVACFVFGSQRSFLGNAFCLLDLLLFVFCDFRSYPVCGIWFRLGMASNCPLYSVPCAFSWAEIGSIALFLSIF